MYLLGPSCHVTSDQDKELMALFPCSMNALFFMMSETVGWAASPPQSCPTQLADRSNVTEGDTNLHHPCFKRFYFLSWKPKNTEDDIKIAHCYLWCELKEVFKLYMDARRGDAQEMMCDSCADIQSTYINIYIYIFPSFHVTCHHYSPCLRRSFLILQKKNKKKQNISPAPASIQPDTRMVYLKCFVLEEHNGNNLF